MDLEEKLDTRMTGVWTDEEEQTLIAMYRDNYSIAEIAAYFETRGIDQIRGKLDRLGYITDMEEMPKSGPWKEDELYHLESKQEHLLQRSNAQITQKKLVLKHQETEEARSEEWTEEQVQLLQQEISKGTQISQIKLMLKNKTYRQVQCKIEALVHVAVKKGKYTANELQIIHQEMAKQSKPKAIQKILQDQGFTRTLQQVESIVYYHTLRKKKRERYAKMMESFTPDGVLDWSRHLLIQKVFDYYLTKFVSLPFERQFTVHVGNDGMYQPRN